MQKSKREQIKHEEDYVAFLETRLKSKNFNSRVTKEEVQKTELKLAKAKLKLKLLTGKL